MSVATRQYGGWQLLLAVLATLMLGGHATHLPLLLEPALSASGGPAIGAPLAQANRDEHSHGVGERSCGPHTHCGGPDLRGSLPIPGHESVCASGVAADRTRASTVPLSLSAVAPVFSTPPRTELRTRSAFSIATPSATLQRAVLQVWRI
ncbi:MAG: hypothetical protein M3Q29_25860 [Chloroflexota bacterium]|nr:hypothetical protein [Chloroflexota bacterium]